MEQRYEKRPLTRQQLHVISRLSEIASDNIVTFIEALWSVGATFPDVLLDDEKLGNPAAKMSAGLRADFDTANEQASNTTVKGRTTK